MSERGLFMTSFLYDNRPDVVDVLRKAFNEISARTRATLHENGKDDKHGTRFFCGMMHGGFGGEEAIWDMPCAIEQDILPHLPKEHGSFTITVTPEMAECARVWEIKNAEIVNEWRAERYVEPPVQELPHRVSPHEKRE